MKIGLPALRFCEFGTGVPLIPAIWPVHCYFTKQQEAAKEKFMQLGLILIIVNSLMAIFIYLVVRKIWQS
jgi:hypothetical protein